MCAQLAMNKLGGMAGGMMGGKGGGKSYSAAKVADMGFGELLKEGRKPIAPGTAIQYSAPTGGEIAGYQMAAPPQQIPIDMGYYQNPLNRQLNQGGY